MSEPSAEMGRVLVVDDDQTNLLTAIDLITPMGFRVATARTGEETLAKVAENPPDIILLDIMMPGITGYEACRRLKNDPQTKHIPVIMLTALDGIDEHVEAFQAGADDFMNKPFNRAIMEVRLRRFFREKRLQEELSGYRKNLELKVNEQTSVIQSVQDVITQTLARFAEYRDPETGAHLERIRHYCQLVAGRLNGNDVPDKDFVNHIFRSSILHDIGKVGIKDEILLKPGKLSPEEFAIMKTHSTIGGKHLSEAFQGLKKNQTEDGFLVMAVEIAYHHHEKFDGTGYPYGKKGTDIPLSARIVAIADVYDALVSKRPYKDPFPVSKALEIIRDGRGTHFDPEVLDCFLQNIDSIVEISAHYADEVVDSVTV